LIAKRLLDIAGSICGLLLLWPLMCIIAIFVWLDSPGPMVFKQVRVGLRGRIFTIYKFRTMYVAGKDRVAGITVAGDTRITPSGRILRKLKLDELPQLLNVLRGEMSLVGPRPELPEYVRLYPPESYQRVLSVRPGITDLASIEFRSEEAVLGRYEDAEWAYREIVLPKKLQLAEQYVTARTFWFDVKIILRTLWALAPRGRE